MLLELPPHVHSDLMHVAAQVQEAGGAQPLRDCPCEGRLHDAALVVPASPLRRVRQGIVHLLWCLTSQIRSPRWAPGNINSGATCGGFILTIRT